MRKMRSGKIPTLRKMARMSPLMKKMRPGKMPTLRVRVNPNPSP